MGIREYQSPDYEPIERIYNDARLDEFYAEQEQFSLVPWSDDEFVQSNLRRTNIYVYEETTIHGFCGCIGNHINWLFVSPQYRRQGIASALLSFVKPTLGIGATLTIVRSNERAKLVYSKFGFVEKETFVVEFQDKNLTVSTLQYIE